MHSASSLDSAEKWRLGAATLHCQSFLRPPDKSFQLASLSDAEMPRDPIEQIIQRRGSTRKFARSSITLPQLSTLLDSRHSRRARGFLDPPGAQLNDLYLIVHAVEGLPPGA